MMQIRFVDHNLIIVKIKHKKRQPENKSLVKQELKTKITSN